MAKEAKATKSLKGQQTLFSFFQKKPSEQQDSHVAQKTEAPAPAPSSASVAAFHPQNMSPDASDSEKSPVQLAAQTKINVSNSGNVNTPSSRDNVGSIRSLPTPMTPQNGFSPNDIPSSPLKRVSTFGNSCL